MHLRNLIAFSFIAVLFVALQSCEKETFLNDEPQIELNSTLEADGITRIVFSPEDIATILETDLGKESFEKNNGDVMASLINYVDVTTMGKFKSRSKGEGEKVTSTTHQAEVWLWAETTDGSIVVTENEIELCEEGTGPCQAYAHLDITDFVGNVRSVVQYRMYSRIVSYSSPTGPFTVTLVKDSGPKSTLSCSPNEGGYIYSDGTATIDDDGTNPLQFNTTLDYGCGVGPGGGFGDE